MGKKKRFEKVFDILDIVVMVKKRRNNGRAKHGRGHVKRVRCELTGALIPKDKAIKRNEVSNPVPARLMPTLIAAGARIIYGPSGPKIIRKVYYCISAALHSNKVHRACDAYRHVQKRRSFDRNRK